jgi:glutaconate CoA-transferase, subunit B
VRLGKTSHRCAPAQRGRPRYRLVERCDFVTSFGHRTADGRTRSELGHRGHGPQWLITDLGVFDFNADGHLRLRQVYPDTTVEEIAENSGFDIVLADDLSIAPRPKPEVIAIIRGLDPLGIHLKELRPRDRERRFAVRLPEAVEAS